MPIPPEPTPSPPAPPGPPPDPTAPPPVPPAVPPQLCLEHFENHVSMEFDATRAYTAWSYLGGDGLGGFGSGAQAPDAPGFQDIAPCGSQYGYAWCDIPQNVKNDVMGRAWPLDAAQQGQAGTVRYNKVAQLKDGQFVDLEIFVIDSSKDHYEPSNPMLNKIRRDSSPFAVINLKQPWNEAEGEVFVTMRAQYFLHDDRCGGPGPWYNNFDEWDVLPDARGSNRAPDLV